MDQRARGIARGLVEFARAEAHGITQRAIQRLGGERVPRLPSLVGAPATGEREGPVVPLVAAQLGIGRRLREQRQRRVDPAGHQLRDAACQRRGRRARRRVRGNPDVLGVHGQRRMSGGRQRECGDRVGPARGDRWHAGRQQTRRGQSQRRQAPVPCHEACPRSAASPSASVRTSSASKKSDCVRTRGGTRCS